jgi:hypothetical protein
MLGASKVMWDIPIPNGEIGKEKGETGPKQVQKLRLENNLFLEALSSSPLEQSSTLPTHLGSYHSGQPFLHILSILMAVFCWA